MARVKGTHGDEVRIVDGYVYQEGSDLVFENRGFELILEVKGSH